MKLDLGFLLAENSFLVFLGFFCMCVLQRVATWDCFHLSPLPTSNECAINGSDHHRPMTPASW
jgi:hypothetical protein